MLHFSELQELPTHEQTLIFAWAYLESAEALCNNLCSDNQNSNYAHGSVVMSLAFHSLELFFKGYILMLHPTEQFGGKAGHDLDALSKRFFKLYPKKEFQFEVPFGHNIGLAVGGMPLDKLDDLLTHIEDHKKKVPQDQLHRYPTSMKGKTWNVAMGFEPNSFKQTLHDLRQAYSRIRTLINSD